MTESLQALKESYYEYVGVIPAGLQTLQALFESGQIEPLLTSLSNLAEGIEALYIIEQKFAQEGYTSTSRLTESIAIMSEINHVLQAGTLEQLQVQFEQLRMIFASATEWDFTASTASI